MLAPPVLAMLHKGPSSSVPFAVQPSLREGNSHRDHLSLMRSAPLHGIVFDSPWLPLPGLQVVNVNQQSEQMKRQIDTELRTLSGTKSPHVVPYLHAYVQVGKALSSTVAQGLQVA